MTQLALWTPRGRPVCRRVLRCDDCGRAVYAAEALRVCADGKRRGDKCRRKYQRARQRLIVLAETAARVTAQRGPLAGLLTAGLLVADPGPDGVGPDAVAVAALLAEGDGALIAWCGDARAYGWDGHRLCQYTTDHTVGEYLRQVTGGPTLAAAHDDWVRTSLSLATVATIHEAAIPAGELVILTSDGVHDQVGDDAPSGGTLIP